MKIAIIGASGKTGNALVGESLQRSHEVVAVCRAPSAQQLEAFAAHDGLTVVTASVVSDADMLTQALAGCDAVVSILISVRRLKATELVRSLVKATAVNQVKRLVFTGGEITAVPEANETFTLRQRMILRGFSFIATFTPFSLKDMIKSSALIRQQTGWDWTIVRAPTLTDGPKTGYRLCELHEVTGKHALSRGDYAACMLDSLDIPEHYRRAVTVIPAEGKHHG